MTRSMLKDLEIRYKKIIRVKEKRKGKREEKQPEDNEPEVKKIKMEEEKLPRSHESEKIRMEEEDEEWKVKRQPTVLMSSTRCKVYRPLLSRPTCGEYMQLCQKWKPRNRKRGFIQRRSW